MFGQHAAFIIPAYAVTFAVMAGLILWTLLTYRSHQRKLADLEKLGVHRRARTVADD